MWPCFLRLLESNATTQDKVSFLRAISFCQNTRLENEEDVKAIGKCIEESINSPIHRYDGLLIWNCALSKSNLYLPNWGKILAAGLQCNDSFAVKEQCSIVLKKMIVAFGSVTDYSGAFHRFLPDLIQILLKDSEKNQGFVSSCECLQVCMTHFPHLLGPCMGEIETLVLNHLDTDSVQTIETLSDMFSKFPRCLAFTFKPKESLGEVFLRTFGKTLNTLHSLLNDILSFQKRNFERLDALPKFEVPCQAKDEIPVMYNKIRSFATLSRCLAKMISSEADRVRVSVEELLGLIQRMFSFEFNDKLQVNNQDSQLLALLFLSYPKICDSAFILLETLILNFSVEEQTSGIMSLVMNAVDISRTSPSAPLFYSQVRSTIWKFLNIWMHQCGCKVANEMVSTKLVKELLTEIAVHSTQVNDQITKLFQYSSCVQALKALSNLHITGSFFEEKDVEDISKTVCGIVRQVQLHSNPTKSFPCPYSNEECRIELYNLLLTCSISGNPSHMKYTLKSVNLFKIASRDPCIKVKEVCHRAFAICRYYLHPKKPPPDYVVHPRPPKIVQVVEEDNPVVDWGTEWQNGQLNGHEPAENGHENDANSSYPGESSYPEDTEASEMAHDDHDSPSDYMELGAVNINSKRTFSQQSSRSYGEDSDSGDEKESSFEEEEERPPRKKAYTVAAHRQRPTIHQISETHRTARERQQAEDSMELGAAVEKSMPELSDGYEEEEDIAMTENGEPEESEDLEDEYLEEEEEAEEDYDADMVEDRQHSRAGEPSPEKHRDTTGELTLEDDEFSHKIETEEVVKSECKGPDSNVEHEEDVTYAQQEPIGSDEHQEAMSKIEVQDVIGNIEHQEEIGNIEHQEEIGNIRIQEAIGNIRIQETVGNIEHLGAMGNIEHEEAIGDVEHQRPVDIDDLQGFNRNEDHQNVESNNPQRTLSTDEQEKPDNDYRREEAVVSQDLNGENEDSDESSSNEPAEVLPQITLSVDEMLGDFVLVAKEGR